mmetsp:Transcript_15384/g.24920  ORF Transcript_15384/g.24920 Transcript_15384/m.24920 type:complete len:274 (+) Transcript_15384:174-995(+)
MTSDIANNSERATPSSVRVEDEAPSQGHMSPRSPLECSFDGHERNAATKLPAAIAKKVSFAPPSVEQNPESKEDSKVPATISARIGTKNDTTRHGGGESSMDQKQQQETKPAEEEATVTAKNEKRRKIKWAKRVRIKEVRHINDISDAERDALWMCQADYQMCKTMVKTTVLMMMRGERISEEDPDFCTRGLEFRTKAGSKIRSRYKLRARSAVLNEQDLQREEGFFDPQFIAMASMDESFDCQEEARQRAVYDAKCIETYLDDVRQGIRGLD